MASSPPSEHRSKKHRFRAFMAQPYKHPKSGIFQLRRKVPDDLRQALARREYKRSLDTRDPTEAKARFVLAWANGALWPGSPAQGRTRNGSARGAVSRCAAGDDAVVAAAPGSVRLARPNFADG